MEINVRVVSGITLCAKYTEITNGCQFLYAGTPI